MYFNKEKKKYALEDINTCYECAEKIGIRDALFLNFGVLLGIIRENDFIEHDNDVDMCVQADKITAEQETEYLKLLTENEMFFARKRTSFRKDFDNVSGQRAAWCSFRHRKDRAKFCHWFMFPWNEYYWWTKAGKWVNLRKFDMIRWGYTKSSEGIMLGIPYDYISNLIEIDFKGIKVNIPARYGSVLDYEYPCWPVPRKGGSSKKNVVCIVDKWDDENTWKIKVA